MSDDDASYFEDIVIGDEVEVGRHTPSRDEIVDFARQWDPQPFHLDEEAGRASLMGGLSASSCHTYAISALIFSRSEGKLRTAAMLELEMSFPNPVRPDEELTLYETFLEKRVSKSRPTLGVVSGGSRMANARGEDVMVTTTRYLVERKLPDPA